MARSLIVDDLDWVVSALTERRGPLVGWAPMFSRPAAAALTIRKAFLEHLVLEAGGKGYRTDASVLIAARRGEEVAWSTSERRSSMARAPSRSSASQPGPCSTLSSRRSASPTGRCPST